ncbi:MAG: hypothetical protein ACREPQ_14755 [Rhodanobacter sp.]
MQRDSIGSTADQRESRVSRVAVATGVLLIECAITLICLIVILTFRVVGWVRND